MQIDIFPYFKALSDETRLRLVNLLVHHELNVGELVEILAMAQPRVSRHLKILVDAGLAVARRDGSWIYYTGVSEGLAREFLGAVEPILATSGALEADNVAAEEAIQRRTRDARAFFDAAASVDEGVHDELLGTFDLPGELTARALRLPTPAGATPRILADLGCGPGELIVHLAPRVGHVIGVDQSANMLEAARARAGEHTNVSLRIGQLEHLPMRDREADVAVISMALHHLAKPREGILEAGRILAPGGSLLLAELKKHPREDLRDSHGDQWLGFTRPQVEIWLYEAGLELSHYDEVELDTGMTLIFLEAVRPPSGPVATKTGMATTATSVAPSAAGTSGAAPA